MASATPLLLLCDSKAPHWCFDESHMQAIFLLPQQTKEARNIGQSDIQRTQSEQKRGRTLSPDTNN